MTQPSARIQWDGEDIRPIMDFMRPAMPIYLAGFSDSDAIFGVETPEGLKVAKKGDWLVKKDDEFNLEKP